MSEISGHCVYESVSIVDLTMMVISRTLADEPVPITNQGLFVEWATFREAHNNDLKPSDLEIESVDIMAKSPDGFYFSIEMTWWVSCNWCELVAQHLWSNIEDGNFNCREHGEEALAQDLADQHNDDVALGLA